MTVRRNKDPNENRVGYKKTKLGWIPGEWLVERLGNVAVVGNGTTPSKKRKDYWRDGNFAWITSARINDFRINAPSGMITKTALNECSLRILPAGTVLVAMVGQGRTRGMSAILEIPASINQNLAYVQTSEQIDPEFLLAFLHHNYIRLRNGGHGSNQDALNCSILKSFTIPLPPLPEQQKIAEILSTWDQMIMYTRELINAKKLRKKGLMQQLLTGKKRLPGFKGQWAVHKLGSVFLERIETGRMDLPLLAITGNRGVIPVGEIQRKDSSSADKSRYKRIDTGDLGYNTMRMWQGVNGLSSLEGIVSPAYTICIPTLDLSPAFIAHYFKFHPVIHRFFQYSQGLVSDTWNLKFHHFSQISLPFPSRGEQEAIAAVFESADNEIFHIETELKSLENQKRGLLQKLLIGTIRVKV